MTSPTSLADSVRSLSGQLAAVAQALSTPSGPRAGDAEPALICALHELATLGWLLADHPTASNGSLVAQWLDVADLALALAAPGQTS